MNSELLYEKIVAMMKEYDLHTGSQGAESVIKDPHTWTGDAARYMPFYGLAANILIDAREGMEKKTTPASTLAAVKRVIKYTEKTSPFLSGVFSHPEDNYHFWLTNGHMLFRFCNDIPAVKHLENAPFDIKPHLNAMIDAANDNTKDLFPLPSVAALKAFQQAEKGRGQAKNKRPVCLNDQYFYNPQYLIDILTIFPDARAIYPENNKSPLYIRSKNGFAMLLPIHPGSINPEKLEQIKVA